MRRHSERLQMLPPAAVKANGTEEAAKKEEEPISLHNIHLNVKRQLTNASGRVDAGVSKIDEFCNQGSISGVKFLHSSYPHWFRALWIICMLLFLSMMFYQLIRVIREYYENPLATGKSTDNFGNATLPMIMICPHSQHSCRIGESRDCFGEMRAVESVFGRCFVLPPQPIAAAGIDSAVQILVATSIQDDGLPVDAGATVSLGAGWESSYGLAGLEVNPGYSLDLSGFQRVLRLPLEGSPAYSQAGCWLLGYLKAVKKLCGCVPLSEPGLPGPSCLTSEELLCVRPQRTALLRAAREKEECRPACTDVVFPAVASYAQFSEKAVTKDTRPEWRSLMEAQLLTTFRVMNELFEQYQDVLQNYRWDIYQMAKVFMNFPSSQLEPTLAQHGAEYFLTILDSQLVTLDAFEAGFRFPLREMLVPVPALFGPGATVTALIAILPSLSSFAEEVAQYTMLPFLESNRTGLAAQLAHRLRNSSDDELTLALLNKTEGFLTCSGDCESEFDRLAAACMVVMFIRDQAQVMTQYKREVDGIFQIENKNRDGVTKKYLIDFLGKAHNKEWKDTRYFELTDLEHVKFFLEIAPFWEDYRRGMQTSVDTLKAFVTETVGPSTGNALFGRFRRLAGLEDVVGDSSRLHDAADFYRQLWGNVSRHELLTSDFGHRMEALIEQAVTFRDNAQIKDVYILRNVMSVTVYLTTLDVTTHTQFLTYDFWTMLSDIGGTVSFYIGGTIITFFEILIWCSEIDKKGEQIIHEREQRVRNLFSNIHRSNK